MIGETQTQPSLLTAEEIDQYGRDGYLGPYTMCTPEERAVQRARLESEILTPTAVAGEVELKDRHLDQRAVFDLAAHPAIVSRAAAIFGPDLLLFATSLFVKEAGYPPFRWHNDAAYWPMEPLICMTAWIALTDSSQENGCVSILPGSHKKPVPHRLFGFDRVSRFRRRRLGQKVLYGQTAERKYIDPSTAIPMEVQAGQFFLFSERVIHNSGHNRSNQRRIGLASRITVPLVRINHDEIPGDHRAILIHGEDRLGFNRLAEPPA